MNSQDNFQPIEHQNSNAVISFANESTFKISNLMEKINSFFCHSILNNLPERLNKTGLGIPPSHKGSCSSWSNYVVAEILEPKSGEWKKGKMRMRVILEFCPDEPEEAESNLLQQNGSSLDDIRQNIS